jgi:hypothetical protein
VVEPDAVVNKPELEVASMEIMVAAAAVLKLQVVAEMPQALWVKEETKMAMAAAAAADTMEAAQHSMTTAVAVDLLILVGF